MEMSIDLREFQPRFRHALFISLFEGLKDNSFFWLVNDHDPAPLRQQLAKMDVTNMGWEYEEQGPEVWKIRISKKSPSAQKSEGCCGICGGHSAKE